MLSLLFLCVAAQEPEPLRFGGFLAQIDGLEEPAAVAVGPGDEIYVVERFAHRVRVFDDRGNELHRFGGPSREQGELLEPQGIAIGPDNQVYVSSTGNDGLRSFDSDGKLLARPGHSHSTRELRTPRGLAADVSRLFVARPRNRSIDKYSFTREPGLHPGDGVRHPLGENAGLDQPVDVALGPEDEVYIADTGRHRIVVLDGQGGVARTWGDFGPYSGQFASPTGIAYAHGRLYVADRDNHRIAVFDRRGKLIYDWGVHALRPHEGNGRLHYPNDVAIAPSGRFAVVCEGFENRVQIFGRETDESTTLARSQERNTAAHFGFGISVAGTVATVVEPSAPAVLVYDLTQAEPIEITRFGFFGQRVGGFLEPVDVELEPEGQIAFVADAGAHRIDAWRIAREPDEPLRYDPLLARLVHSYDFRVEHERGIQRISPFPIEPVAIASDRAGCLWVIDAAGSGVLRFDLLRDGERVTGLAPQSSPLKASAAFRWPRAQLALRIPTDLAVARSGEILYVVDAGEQRVEAYRILDIDRAESIEPAFTFGGFGTAPGQFVRPTGICAGVDGFVYVTDEGGHRVSKFDEQGKFVAAWGEQGLGRVQFYKPRGISQAADGKLYVVDYGNHRGQVLTSEGEFVVAFGARAFTQPTRTTK